jgi:hypothetical protein
MHNARKIKASQEECKNFCDFVDIRTDGSKNAHGGSARFTLNVQIDS